MKKTIKILAVLAVMVIALMSMMTNFANAATITLNVPDGSADADARTFSAYKIFNVATDENGNYTYSFTEESEAFFASYTAPDEAHQGITFDNAWKAVEYLNEIGTDTDMLLAFGKAYAAAANTTAVATDIKLGEAKEVGTGYFVIIDNKAEEGKYTPYSAAIVTTVTENMAIDMKALIPEITKEANTPTQFVGSDVEYTITIPVPSVVGYNTHTYTVTDSFKGLNLKADSFVITAEGIDPDVLDDYYTKETGTDNFSIAFNFKAYEQKIGEDAYKALVGNTITIKYTATVTEDAVVTNTNSTDKGAINDATLTYSNGPDNSTDTTPIEEIVKVDTYSVKVNKIDPLGNFLQGAKFQLKFGNDIIKFRKVADKNEYIVDPTGTTDEIEILEGGITFSGLKEGTYTLVETTVPENYATPGDTAIQFTINKNTETDAVTSTISTNSSLVKITSQPSYTSGNDLVFALDVINTRSNVLPTTGGMGTKIFTAVGVVVMISAAAILVYRNRKNK